MAELKTKKNDGSVGAFLDGIADEQKRKDSHAIIDMMWQATGAEPKMWGGSIVGFGEYHYKSSRSGSEGDWFVMGFSPRKQNLTLYLMGGLSRHEELLTRLGKHKRGKGCLYINRLSDINVPALREMIEQTARQPVEADESGE